MLMYISSVHSQFFWSAQAGNLQGKFVFLNV